MSYIFYDLETSGLNRVNQILNFAFVVTNEKFSVIDELTGDVKISRLQLPEPKAIQVTGLDVLEHQEKATLTELEAVEKIASFFEEHKRSTLVGYNSSGFDLPFLRTVFIRNGVNPYSFYFSYKDIYTSVKYLASYDQNFRKLIFSPEEPDKKLETVARLLGVLEGEQEHESLFDVKLTINVAKALIANYRHNPLKFNYYQLSELHNEPKGSVFNLERPVFAQEQKVETFAASLLDYDKSYALWLVPSDNERPVKWTKFSEHLYLPSSKAVTEEEQQVVTKALKDYSEVSLDNWFKDSTCYIEEDIYRLPAKLIDTLGHAQRSGIVPEGASPDFKQLYQRFILENYDNDLSGYANFRYGGKLELKYGDKHPTLTELETQIAEISSEESKLMKSLQTFYDNSELKRCLTS